MIHKKVSIFLHTKYLNKYINMKYVVKYRKYLITFINKKL